MRGQIWFMVPPVGQALAARYSCRKGYNGESGMAKNVQIAYRPVNIGWLVGWVGWRTGISIASAYRPE